MGRSVRRFLATLVLLGVAVGVPAEARMLGYVSNDGDSRLSVFDVETETSRESIRLCDEPDLCSSFSVGAAADGSRVLVTSDMGLLVIDPRRNEIVRRLPFPALHVAVTADGGRAILAGCGAGAGETNGGPVCDVDLDEGTIRAVYPVPYRAERIALARSARLAVLTTAYESAQYGGFVAVLDLEAGGVFAGVYVPGRAVDVAMNPDDHRAYALSALGHLTVIDAIQQIAVKDLSLGMNARRLAVSADGTKAYITASALPEATGDAFSEAVLIFDTNSEEITGRIELADQNSYGNRPIGIGLSPDGQRAFVVENESYDVRVVDLAAGQVGTAIGAGEGAAEIAIVEVSEDSGGSGGGCAVGSTAGRGLPLVSTALCALAFALRRAAVWRRRRLSAQPD